ncbi:DUF4123 domain-containing protein [Collimonas arenae]|uniref:DUF4123 domain-containing protein n=1 Tax=Collimonas arenae TaxID=279058 RepID=UPI00056DA67E|nr:DUF4123 domain-containing protein [Collimonas arenae]
MTETIPKISSFLLIDSAMLGGTEAFLSMMSDARPAWLIPIYREDAATVSPLVIDIEAAERAGQLELMMALVNARQPQLHVSIIETVLTHQQLAQHLRHFICVRLDTGKEPTLRFADCCILPALAHVLTPAQWTTFVGPVVRWCVHERDGTLTTLPQADQEQAPVATPFILTAQQVESLKESAAADQLIGNVQRMRYGQTLSGNPVEQHQWASEARRIWHAAGHYDNGVLFSLASAIFDTRGGLLMHPELPDILAQKNTASICRDLQQAAIRL